MTQYAMLIDFGHCTGCMSCEVSCRKEKGMSLDEWGIQVQQIGPKRLGGKWEWDYVPVPSSLCDLCADRREDGKVPLCELHCLAKVIEVIPVEDVPARMAELGTKVTCFMP